MDTPENRFLWQRNVRDQYKSVSTEDIKNDLKEKALPAGVLVQNLEKDFNIGTILRSANAFGIFDFYYYGARHWDRRGCQGSYHYVNVNHFRTLDEVKQLKERYVFVGMENNTSRGSVDIRKYQWRSNSLIVIGEEKDGITNELLDLCDDLVEIPIQGSVRSFNAGVASSIAFYDYVNKTQ
jgi:tRNA G18 (ribose-2'-O)-methylase SpoU